MLIISSRKNFDDPDSLKKQGHDIKEVNLSSDKVIRDLTSDNFFNEIKHLKILFIVHGYNNEQDEVYDAYSVIENNIVSNLNSTYDLIIGYSWPGGDLGLEWFSAKSRANSVARRFRFLITKISNHASSLDIMSHSLGARVVLKALKQAESRIIVRNYFCMAAAVDNEVLEKNEEFHQSISKIQNLYVFHSQKDGVLTYFYRMAEWDNPLGRYGPEDKDYIENHTKSIYVANCKRVVDSHGGYKRSNSVYKYIKNVISSKPSKFSTLV